MESIVKTETTTDKPQWPQKSLQISAIPSDKTKYGDGLVQAKPFCTLKKGKKKPVTGRYLIQMLILAQNEKAVIAPALFVQNRPESFSSVNDTHAVRLHLVASDLECYGIMGND